MATHAFNSVIQHLRQAAARQDGEGLTDGELLDSYVQGRDPGAFEVLVRRHGPMVYGVCRRILRNETDAEDAFQATFLVLVRKAAGIRPRGAVSNWLYGVARNTALKAKEMIHKRRAKEKQAAALPKSETSEDAWRQLQTTLDDALGQIADKYRVPIVLCELEGKTIKEAARQLGWPQGTVATRLAKGRGMLAKRLSEHGLTLSAGALTAMLSQSAASACVLAPLLGSTVKAASAFAAGTAASGVINAKVATLAESVVRSMLLTKLMTTFKIATAILFLAGAVGLSFRVLAAQRTPVPPSDVKTQTNPVDAPTSDKEKLIAKDSFGDPLPDGAVARLGNLRWNHGDRVTFAAFAADGKAVITAGVDKTIRVWEYPSGKELRRIGLPGADKAVNQRRFNYTSDIDFPVALNKDGKTLAVCVQGNEILLYDMGTGKVLRKWMAGSARVKSGPGSVSLAFSPGGEHLAILSRDGSAGVWDWGKAKELYSLPSSDQEGLFSAGSVAWSPDGKLLATSKADVTTSGGAFGSFTRTRGALIEIWNSAAGNKLRTVAPLNFVGEKVLFSPDSKVLAVSSSGRNTRSNGAEGLGGSTLVNVDNGKQITTWKDTARAAALLFSPDGARLYGRPDHVNTVVELQVSDGKPLRKIAVARPASSYQYGVHHLGLSAAWSQDTRVLVFAGGANTPQFVDVAAGKEIPMGAGPLSPVSAVFFTADGKHLWTRGETDFHKWDAVTGKQLDQPTFQKRSWYGPISPDGKLLVASKPAKLRGDPNSAFVDVASGKEVETFQLEHRAPLFSPNGKLLATRDFYGSDIMVYEAPSGTLLHALPLKPARDRSFPNFMPSNREPVQATSSIVLFSPDSQKLAFFADPKKLVFLNVATGQRVGELTREAAGTVRSGAFSPDGRCVVLEADTGTAVLYELASGQVRRIYDTEERPVSDVIYTGLAQPRIAFGRGGQVLCRVGADQAIHVWDVDSGEELAVFKGHANSVDAIAVSADGKALASASADTTVLLWDLARIKRPSVVKALTQGEREARWQMLLDADGARAFAAICDLSASPEGTLSLLKDRVKPAPRVEMKRIESLFAALGSDQLKTREEAHAELLWYDKRLVPAIDEALTKNPPLEFKRRLEQLHVQVSDSSHMQKGEWLRASRAVEILERIGTPQAGQLLQALADGAPGTSLTTSAQATLQRLKRQE